MPRSRDRRSAWTKAHPDLHNTRGDDPLGIGAFRWMPLGSWGVWISRGIAGLLTTVTAHRDGATVELGRTFDDEQMEPLGLLGQLEPELRRASYEGYAVEERQAFVVRPEGLAAYVAMPDGDRVDPRAALGLVEARHAVELAGVLSPCAWCVNCGTGFTDRRVGKRHVESIARWCPACRNRYHREMRRCAAVDCRRGFWPQDSKHVYCRPACARAAQRALKRERARSGRLTRHQNERSLT